MLDTSGSAGHRVKPKNASTFHSDEMRNLHTAPDYGTTQNQQNPESRKPRGGSQGAQSGPIAPDIGSPAGATLNTGFQLTLPFFHQPRSFDLPKTEPDLLQTRAHPLFRQLQRYRGFLTSTPEDIQGQKKHKSHPASLPRTTHHMTTLQT